LQFKGSVRNGVKSGDETHQHDRSMTIGLLDDDGLKIYRAGVISEADE
jgi:hypothetical protein